MGEPKFDCFDDGDWGRRMESLVRISESGAWSVDAEAVYEHVCVALIKELRAENAFLHLVTDNDVSALRRYGASLRDDQSVSEWGEWLPRGVGRTEWLFETHELIFMDYAHPDVHDRLTPEAQGMGYRWTVTLPVVYADEVLGMCSVSFVRSIKWADDDITYLKLIGRIIGVIVNRVRAAKRHSELLLLEERARLSSEIHDNVSHLLGSLSLSVGSAIASLEEDDMRAVERSMERVEDLCGQTMRMFRGEMLNLRMPLEHAGEWVDALRDTLDRFQEEWGIQTRLSVSAACEPLSVSAQAALQLSRILNECLTNTLRHARASHVSVIILENEAELQMSVADNGQGFDVDEVAPERLGLKIMRERAAAVGGSVSIQSRPGGTCVTACIPRLGS